MKHISQQPENLSRNTGWPDNIPAGAHPGNCGNLILTSLPMHNAAIARSREWRTNRKFRFCRGLARAIPFSSPTNMRPPISSQMRVVRFGERVVHEHGLSRRRSWRGKSERRQVIRARREDREVAAANL